MPIKQLQLRGISRTPSDRASADGGLAESLNVHLDQGELAPTLPPKDISSGDNDIVFGTGNPHNVFFVHKTMSAENYIGIKYGVSSQSFYITNGSAAVTIENAPTVPTTETVKHATSIGNTLIVYTDAKPYYFIFKDSKYYYLGESIPKPMVEVISVKGTAKSTSLLPGDGIASAELDWNDVMDQGGDNKVALERYLEKMWDQVKTMISQLRGIGYFAAPFFLRYAMRLYDGSYIYSSTPILCGGYAEQDAQNNIMDWFTAYRKTMSWLGIQAAYINASINYPFMVYLRSNYSVGGWSDIVKSIDFFASEPIYAPKLNAAFEGVKSQVYQLIFDGMDAANRDHTIKQEVTSRGQFYKIASFDVNDAEQMHKLNIGTQRILASDETAGDLLLTSDNFPDSYRDGSRYIPDADVQNFNNRVMLIGSKEIVSRGDACLNGQCTAFSQVSDSLPNENFRKFILRYMLVDASGQTHYVLANYRDGGTWMYTGGFTTRRNYVYYGNAAPDPGPYCHAKVTAWLAFPDSRCKQVEVYRYYSGTGTIQGKKIPMEPHPYLECAYAFLGFGVTLDDVLESAAYGAAEVGGHNTENLTVSAENKILLSDFENPFLFSAGNIISFKDKLIGAAGVTVPLSEGQVGDFSMYVFTEGGIRVMIPTADGTFAATMAHPNMSRYVALPGTILGMEQAVVFTTEKGVMMLSGGTVTNISSVMNGKPYSLTEGGVATEIAQSDWWSLISAASASETFMGFMRTARPAYDFTGSRLIFFNPNKDYQYVFMLKTQTWHKILTGVVLGTASAGFILNKYPECWVSYLTFGSHGAINYHVLDFSTNLKDADILADSIVIDSVTVRKTYKGIIATRPFILGEPDIRKTIRSIRIRGNYRRGDVRYLLLGSFDGINWKLTKTLRGGSYKQFRIVLLVNMSAMERITWIDVDYESRFTNRLR